MAFKRRFEFGLAWRIALLVLSIWLFVAAVRTPGLAAGRIVIAAIAIAAISSLWGFIRRTNFQVARFIESVRFEDYSQRFSDPSGGGFDVLGDTLDAALKQLQSRHTQTASDARYFAAIVDDSPSALLAIDSDGRVEMLNKSARQLFARQSLTHVDEFEKFGAEIAAAVKFPPGTRKITRLILDGIPQRALFASSQVARLDAGFTMISILPVQSELGALEVAVQADLVRVLTHEIMNSLTPVTSLARSGADMVAAAEVRGADVGEARVATDTVARRAEGLLRFVESYREFAQSPKIHRRSFAVKPWSEEIMRLALTSATDRKVESDLRVIPESLNISGDPELLAQALLNLLRNAIRATVDVPQPVVRMTVMRHRSIQCLIEVTDNGPGIPGDRREDVFLPFYTTHKGGSGVGLSFARQVALAHGGSISAREAPGGGASIQIVL